MQRPRRPLLQVTGLLKSLPTKPERYKHIVVILNDDTAGFLTGFSNTMEHGMYWSFTLLNSLIYNWFGIVEIILKVTF